MAELTIPLTFLLILTTTAAVARDHPRFPLNDGWTNGYVPEGATGDPVEYDVVDGATSIHGASVRAVNRTYAFETNIYETAYCSVDGDGSLLLHDRSYGFTGGSTYEEVWAPPLPLLPRDPAPGDAWSRTCTVSYYRDGVLSSSRDVEAAAQVVGLDPALTVTAGSYAALEAVVTREGGSLHNWFALGIGLVRGTGVHFDAPVSDLAVDSTVPREEASWGDV